jgi:hypothetical protein
MVTKDRFHDHVARGGDRLSAGSILVWKFYPFGVNLDVTVCAHMKDKLAFWPNLPPFLQVPSTKAGFRFTSTIFRRGRLVE